MKYLKEREDSLKRRIDDQDQEINDLKNRPIQEPTTTILSN